MKIYQRIFVVGMLIAPVSALAVTMDADVTLELADSYTLTYNSVYDSMVVNATDFVFTLSGGQSAKIISADKRSFAVSPSANGSATCGSSSSEVVINVPSGADPTAITVTPSGTCSSSSSSSSGSGGGNPSIGGGGGGGGGAPSVPPQTPAAASGASAAQKALIEQLQSQIALLMAQISAFKGVPLLPPQASPVAGIARTLAFGAQGSDVTLLQSFLAKDPSVYPEGKITGYFGRLTSEAVKRFQKKNGIDQLGIVGPKTRAKLNQLMSQ